MSDTYILKARLAINDEQYKELNKLMGIYCHIQNVMIKHAKNCIANLERDKAYQATRGYKLSKEEITLCNKLMDKYQLDKYMFHKYISKQTKLFKGKVNSHVVQKISDRVWSAVEKYLFYNGEEIHFKQRRKFSSFVNKNNETDIVYKNGMIKINDMYLPVVIRNKDILLKDSLKNNQIKYCQIVRKWHKHKYRYYVYFSFKGNSANKYITQNDTVGIDIGPSTIAVDSNSDTFICELGQGINTIERELFILNRHLDRQRRSNNPDNYNEDGTVKKGKKKWYKSKQMRITEDKIKMLYQKRANKLEYSHNILAKYILSLGNKIIIEDMNWAALAKKAKKTEKNDKGRFKKKKRFGKSIANHAPQKLISLLITKAKACEAEVIQVDCFKTCATQYKHTTGEFIKHSLQERTFNLGNDKIQRDLHSAFNLRHIIISKYNDKIKYSYDNTAMDNDYPLFKYKHDICMQKIKELRKAGQYIPACI